MKDINELCVQELLTKEAADRSMKDVLNGLAGPDAAKEAVIKLSKQMRNRGIVGGLTVGAATALGGRAAIKAMLRRREAKRMQQTGVQTVDGVKQAAINVHPSNLVLADLVRNMQINLGNSKNA